MRVVEPGLEFTLDPKDLSYKPLTVQARKLRPGTAKTRPLADYDSDHDLLIAKIRLMLKKVGKPPDHSGTT